MTLTQQEEPSSPKSEGLNSPKNALSERLAVGVRNLIRNGSCRKEDFSEIDNAIAALISERERLNKEVSSISNAIDDANNLLVALGRSENTEMET